MNSQTTYTCTGHHNDVMSLLSHTKLDNSFPSTARIMLRLPPGTSLLPLLGLFNVLHMRNRAQCSKCRHITRLYNAIMNNEWWKLTARPYCVCSEARTARKLLSILEWLYRWSVHYQKYHDMWYIYVKWNSNFTVPLTYWWFHFVYSCGGEAYPISQYTARFVPTGLPCR